LVKFHAAAEHKEVCALEDLYAQLARACGLEIPATRSFDFDARLGAFGIERFDIADGMHVPVHTLAGALHADFRTPSLDYISFLRATRLITRDEREVRKAYECAAFNVAFHNRDDHAKNFSYGLASTAPVALPPATT
jgi:serine/threonine-protein kinase HipA